MDMIYANESFNNTNETDEWPSDSYLRIVLSNNAQFGIYLASEIPSLFCCVFLLFNLCFDQTLRKALHNHVIIIVLIFTFFVLIIDIPNYLCLFYLSHIWLQTAANCYIWLYADTAGYYGLGMLMAWASIERHILIFHHHWFSTTRGRILFHFIPLIAVTLYPCILYIVLIFFLPCQQTFDYTQYTCGGACAYHTPTIATIDGFVNGTVPTLLIVLFNILLLIRVIKQRQRLHRQVQWQKHRRMIIQLFSCSSVFFVFNLPLVCIYMARSFGMPYGATGQFEMFVYFLSYFVVLWMPFVCLGSSPEILMKMKKLVKKEHLTIRTERQ